MGAGGLHAEAPAVVLTSTGLEGAELTSSAIEKGHGGEHLARKGQVSELKGSPKGSWLPRLEKSKAATQNFGWEKK